MSKGNINIEEMINKAAKQAIKEYDQEKREEARKKVFHNTGLLLKNYNSLMEHYKNAIDTVDISRIDDQIETEIEELESEDELFIRSIRKSKFRTFIMLSHIDMALGELKNEMEHKHQSEKYNTLKMYYIQEKTFEEIAEQLNCSVITARRWKNEMIGELSIFLFGIDGMKIEI
jgi:hypothetical protein